MCSEDLHDRELQETVGLKNESGILHHGEKYLQCAVRTNGEGKSKELRRGNGEPNADIEQLRAELQQMQATINKIAIKNAIRRFLLLLWTF